MRKTRSITHIINRQSLRTEYPFIKHEADCPVFSTSNITDQQLLDRRWSKLARRRQRAGTAKDRVLEP